MRVTNTLPINNNKYFVYMYSYLKAKPVRNFIELVCDKAML